MHIKTSNRHIIYPYTAHTNRQHNQYLRTFSHNGSINVNKSRELAFVSNTSAPPALPNIISPANLAALVAILRSDRNVSSEGSASIS